MTTDISGLIPVRGFSTGKTRLAGTLTVEARASIMQWMLRGVITAALTANVLDELMVISPDTSALAYARALDQRVVPVLQREHTPGLNPAVTIGRDLAARRGAAGVLVLFGDLPFLTAPDVQAIVAEPAAVVVATDRHELGTNASLVRFVGNGRDFEYQYGSNSARLHAQEADRLGLTFATIRRPGTAFDLDTPEDWRTLSANEEHGAQRQPFREEAPNGAQDEVVAAGEREER